MTDDQRFVLELTEAWFDSRPDGGPRDDSGLYAEITLYAAVAAMRARAIPYVPTEMFGDLSVQIMLESQRQERMGAHLIAITEVEITDGVRVETDAHYLETNNA